MTLKDTVTLNQGPQMPVFGLGCYKVWGDDCYHAVRWALEAGYAMVDAASRYENEAQIGRALKDSGIPREEIFVVSKLWPTQFQEAEKGLSYSLRQMQLDRLDLYLLHWPGTDETARFRAWEQLLEERARGRVRAIGVSNFTVGQIDGLINEFGVAPAVNQTELHPWYQQRDMAEYCRKFGIAREAWGPIFRGNIGQVPLMEELGKAYGKTPVQITLRWHLQKGHIVIPKSCHKGRIWENSQVFDFMLSQQDMEKIDMLECGRHFGNNPATYSGDDFFVRYH